MSKYKKINNLFIVFETDSTEIICIFERNIYNKKKVDDFCLFINKNEVHYHTLKDKKKKMNKNEIPRNERNIKFPAYYKPKKENLIVQFFEYYKDKEEFYEYSYNSEAFIEIYQINFNN